MEDEDSSWLPGSDEYVVDLREKANHLDLPDLDLGLHHKPYCMFFFLLCSSIFNIVFCLLLILLM